MKKVAIVCDNYKLRKFKEELLVMGFKIKTYPFTAETTTIKIEVDENKIDDVAKLCGKIELHFKRSN